MKVLIVLLALVPLVWGEEIQEIQAIAEAKPRRISKKIINIIERIRDKMPCGFPELDIPPLVPLQITHQEINIDITDMQVFGNTLLYGLNNFEVVKLKMKARRASFKFYWKKVNLLTHYNVSMARNDKGLKRNGTTQLSIEDFTAWGELKFKYSLKSKKLSIKELRVEVSLGDVELQINGLSKKHVISQEINNIIEESSDNVSKFINIILVPRLNDILYDKTLSELLAMLHAGENETCMPPNKDSD